MTVYVDDMKAPFGRMIMCHCWADTREELFGMMERIGVQTKWFQQPPKASWEHFDISMTKRAQAVRCGAIETDKWGPVEFEARRKFIDAVAAGRLDKAMLHLNKLCTVGRLRIRRMADDVSYDDILGLVAQ